MTRTDKPVRRETYTSVRDRGKSRPLVIELHSTYLRIRAKGRRQFYSVTFDQVWNIGAQNAAAQLKQARIEAKKNKRGKAGAA